MQPLFNLQIDKGAKQRRAKLSGRAKGRFSKEICKILKSLEQQVPGAVLNLRHIASHSLSGGQRGSEHEGEKGA